VRLRVLVGAVVASVAVLLLPAAAWAHVTVNPGEAPKGSFTELAFRVPNETDDTNTTKVDVQIPTDHPIASVSVQPKPGWTYEVKKVKLAKPISSDDGPVTEAVSEIIWSGGTIRPGEYDDFYVSAGPLPTDVDQIEFKTIQTYSDGSEVAWIQDTPPGGEEPERPAPVLTLTDAAGDAHGSTATTTPSTTAPSGDASPAAAADTPTQSDVDSAKTIAIIGLIVGAVGLVVGGVALFMRRSGGTAG
jgi:uncharacterized protein YcnI